MKVVLSVLLAVLLLPVGVLASEVHISDPAPLFCNNWLRVLDTAESSQVDQRVGHQLHAIMPLLDAFKSALQEQTTDFLR
jgi:hypothetical protein